MSPTGRIVMDGETDGRRASDKKSRGDEPVSVKVFVGVLTGVVLAVILWAASTGAGSVTSARRFELDSARRDVRDSTLTRDMREIKATGLRTDSGVTRLCVMLSTNAARDCR